jgi:hypothetical protein
MYSTSKKFTKKTTKTVNIGEKSVRKAIKKLKPDKKYHVRIRTYKKVTVSGEATKIYSAYSDAKTIVVK